MESQLKYAWQDACVNYLIWRRIDEPHRRNFLENAIVLILYVCRFYACFIAVACISRVRFTNCSCARSSRSDFCRVMEFRYIRCRVGSSIVVLSCQNNAGSACHERTFIRSDEHNVFLWPCIDWERKGPVCFVIFGTNNIFKDHCNFSHRDLFLSQPSKRPSCSNEWILRLVFEKKKKKNVEKSKHIIFLFSLSSFRLIVRSILPEYRSPAAWYSPRVTWRSFEVRHYRSKDLCESSRKDDTPEKYISERNLRSTRRRRDMQTFDYAGDASSLNWIMSVPPNEPPSSDNAAAMIIYNSINAPCGARDGIPHSNLLLSTHRMLVLPFFQLFFPGSHHDLPCRRVQLYDRHIRIDDFPVVQFAASSS